MEEVNADRQAHGKKPFDDDGQPPAPPKKRRDNTSKKKLARRKKEKLRTVKRSVTDPDSGLFVKGEHKRQFAYEGNTSGSLPMRPTRPATGTALYWRPWSPPAMYMTAWPLMKSMTV